LLLTHAGQVIEQELEPGQVPSGAVASRACAGSMTIGYRFQPGWPMSAVIMLGSVLEGILVDIAKHNMTQACQTVPPPRNRDGQLPVEEWKLSHLIDVAHKCRWIDLDVKRFSQELREYRNMVHAAGELKDGHHPDGYTFAICREVAVAALNDLSRISSPSAPAA
jgi:hypothetical protein